MRIKTVYNYSFSCTKRLKTLYKKLYDFMFKKNVEKKSYKLIDIMIY